VEQRVNYSGTQQDVEFTVDFGYDLVAPGWFNEKQVGYDYVEEGF